MMQKRIKKIVYVLVVLLVFYLSFFHTLNYTVFSGGEQHDDDGDGDKKGAGREKQAEPCEKKEFVAPLLKNSSNSTENKVDISFFC
jgi:hypothetical protein